MGKEKELPQGWLEVQLNDVIAKPQYGWTSKSTPSGRIKYLRTTDLSKGTVDWDTVPYCKKEPEDVDKYQLKSGDIVVSRAGSVGLSFLLLGPPNDAVFASYLIRLRPIVFPSKFLAYFLKSPRFWSVVHSVSSGIAVQNINATKLKEMSFPLPPLPEQHRIVAKLDALMARVAVLEAGLARIPQLLADFRQSVLSKAVTGALTEEWRAGKELVRSIKDASSSVRPDHDVPDGWICTSIKAIGEVKGGKRLPKGEKLLLEDTGLPYIRARDLKRGTVLSEQVLFLSPNVQSLISRYTVKADDVYITIVGAKIGDVGIIPPSMDGANLTENAAKITSLHNVNAEYLSIWLRSGICQTNIRNAIMSAAQGKLALHRIKALPIYVPTRQEQAEIVRCVESLFAKADAIEARYEALKKKVETLPQATLAKAFRGELVPQLPGDGDARELLAEIKALQAASK